MNNHPDYVRPGVPSQVRIVDDFTLLLPGKKMITKENNNSSNPEVESWGLTYLVAEDFTITWKIPKFYRLLHEFTTGDVLISPPYSIPNNEFPYAIVTLHCYPQGCSSDYKRSIGLFMKIQDTEMDQVFLTISFQIVPADEESLLKLPVARLPYDNYKSWGCPKLVSLLTLLIDSDNYLSNECLEIQVTGSLSGEYRRSDLHPSEDFAIRDLSILPTSSSLAEFDLTISTVENETFGAHRVIIACVCETLKNFLSNGIISNLPIGDYNNDAVLLFLYYSYNNHNLPQQLNYFEQQRKITVLLNVLRLAITYEIKRLKGLCELELRKELNEEQLETVMSLVYDARNQEAINNIVAQLFA